MKNFKQILVAIFVLTLITACEKDENDPKNEILEKATISAKWTVNNSSDYESFEFNESGNYIVVKKTSTKSTNDQVVIFGTYEITDNKTILLSNFGTLTITEIDKNSMSFSILLISNPDSQVSMNTSKEKELESSTNTDLLCRSWEIVSFGGEPLPDYYLLISAAGTYLAKGVLEGEEITGLGTWTWCNTGENKFAFTIDNTLDCGGIEIIKDIQLTSESFRGISMENGEPMELIMQPASSKKSARLKNQKDGVLIFGIEK